MEHKNLTKKLVIRLIKTYNDTPRHLCYNGFIHLRTIKEIEIIRDLIKDFPPIGISIIEYENKIEVTKDNIFTLCFFKPEK